MLIQRLAGAHEESKKARRSQFCLLPEGAVLLAAGRVEKRTQLLYQNERGEVYWDAITRRGTLKGAPQRWGAHRVDDEGPAGMLDLLARVYLSHRPATWVDAWLTSGGRLLARTDACKSPTLLAGACLPHGVPPLLTLPDGKVVQHELTLEEGVPGLRRGYGHKTVPLAGRPWARFELRSGAWSALLPRSSGSVSRWLVSAGRWKDGDEWTCDGMPLGSVPLAFGTRALVFSQPAGERLEVFLADNGGWEGGKLRLCAELGALKSAQVCFPHAMVVLETLAGELVLVDVAGGKAQVVWRTAKRGRP